MKPNVTVENVAGENQKQTWSICAEMTRSMAYPSFFCSCDWLKASAANLTPKDRFIFLVVKGGRQAKALLPLVSKYNALGGRDLHFLGTDFYPDPVGLICSPADRAESAAAIKEYLLTVPGWDRLILDWVLEDELVDWRLPGRHICIEPYKPLSQNFEDLLAEFKQKKRYNLRAMVRKLAEAGGELVTPADNNNHKDFLEALFTLHEKRAAERSIKSTFEGIRVQSLHRQLVEKSESARFYGLRMNHELIAVLYGFEFCSRFFYYQVAHDPSYGDLSPGSVLLFLVIEECCSKGMTEFNFLQGDESYKGIWTDKSRVLYRGVLSRGTWRSRLLDSLEQAKRLHNRLGWVRGGT